jgi:hypothetical protein
MKDTIDGAALSVKALIDRLNELSRTNTKIDTNNTPSGTPTGINQTVPNSNNGGSSGGSSTPSIESPSVSPKGDSNVWSVRLVSRENEKYNTYVVKKVSEEKARASYKNEKKYRETNGEFYSRVELLKGDEVIDKFIFPYRIGGGGAYTPALTAMATGGYTGDFGPEGRMAVLHEKELVLNKQDTINMLKMVNVAREVLGNTNFGLPLI